MLGPDGVGLINVFNSIIEPVMTFSSLGIQTSGVREIALAHKIGDEVKTANVVLTVRSLCWISGVFGTVLMVVLANPISIFAFQTSDKYISIALLGVIVLLKNISNAQTCLIQGLRRIKDLAKMNVYAGILSTIIIIPIYYFFKINGIVPALITTQVVILTLSWHYSRKVKIKEFKYQKNQFARETKALLKLGVPLMLTMLLTPIFSLGSRIYMLRIFQIEDIGKWSAAQMLSGILIGFILQAMAADYYPRLTSVSTDNIAMTDEVNAQAHIALLLATPALIATMLFTPLLITLFYSNEFDAAVPILRWSVFGMFGRVISWPISFIILAKSMGKFFFINDLLGYLTYILGLWFFTRNGNLTGAGQAFALQYGIGFVKALIYGFLIIRYKPSQAFVSLLLFSFLGLLVSFLVSITPIRNTYYIPLSILIFSFISFYCLVEISKKTGFGLSCLKERFLK